MHEYNHSLDLNRYLQYGITALAIVFSLIYFIKHTAAKYFVVDGDDHSHSHSQLSSIQSDAVSSSSMPGLVSTSDSCAVCGSSTTKQCARCKFVKYCSESCQKKHWRLGHNKKCEEFRLSSKSSLQGRRSSTAVALVPGAGTSTQLKKILFPYDKFVELFNWKNRGFPPCGLLNCGNSCFANVVLQCLSYTRPLAAYLLENGHRSECRRNDWCFLCELQAHMERASQSNHAFSPINILSRLPNIGGNFGYGKQEDAHEFMRFVIDTMQSVCLDVYGGERAVHPSSQETTLIQHIFGGRLHSQVICTKCNNISNQFENMMDLTVEIHGDAASLEECLDQFTAKEWLDGDNKYKCDGCNDYVLALKRLNINVAPNILTIALKRFQRGRFGKLNKRVTFPETLDLSPYMSKAADSIDKYKLYAVVVHLDMLNASYFGHYICYAKDFSGNWYRIDDCKVEAVELDEVLSQRAYMLLYSRVSARPSCLNPIEETQEKKSNLNPPVDCSSDAESADATDQCDTLLHTNISCANASTSRNSLDSAMELHTSDSNTGSSSLGDNVDSGSDCTVTFEDTNCSTENNNGIDKSVSVQSDISDNVEGTVGISSSHLTDVEEVANGTVFVNFEPKPDKVESSISSPIRDSSEELVKTISSAAKLKPLISPGFLGKRPRKILNTQKDEKAVECKQANGDLKPVCFKDVDIVESNTKSVGVVNGGESNVV
ncbi:ubiquitin carboxyl-terminal hydrolase 18-like [Rutidosis leptorrhynchoides]|uniref:ubiquitin carboxyl-terminal hydrolase 18-like n=1 Tax=Rutidosis leptorrhynchoides TaxID=125765 RepID=UPI003A99A1CD